MNLQPQYSHFFSEYSYFFSELSKMYEELEHCIRLFAYGGGWILSIFSDIGEEMSLEDARKALARAQNSAKRLAEAPDFMKQRVSSYLEEAEKYWRKIAMFFKISRHLRWRRDNVQKRREIVRNAAREMLAWDYKYAARRVHVESALSLARIQWASELYSEKAQTELAKAEMYKAQGKFECEKEARSRAEENFKQAEDARREAEKEAARLQGECDAMWRQLNGQDAKILAVVKQGLAQSKANAKKLDGIDDSARRAEDAATDAALQAAKTRAAVENKKREEIHYPHLWDTLQEVKTAEDKGECFTVDHYAEILSQARAKGRRLGKIDERRLRRICEAWKREGWKNAGELEAGWKAIKRKEKE